MPRKGSSPMNSAALGLAAVLFAYPGTGTAELDWRLGTIVGSEHYYDSDDLNEDHRGSWYGCLEGICYGEYENSHSTPERTRDSRWLAYSHSYGQWWGVELTAVAGVVDGYKGTATSDEQLTPFAMLGLSWSIFKVHQVGRVTAYGFELNSRLFREGADQ